MSEGIVDKMADAMNTAGERLRETFGGTEGEMGRTPGGEKDRTQTSASEDAHDLATAAERKTNKAIDRVKEAGQEMSQRADDTYKDTKRLAADESDKMQNAVDDMKARATENAPGCGTQDPQLTSETGTNAGYEAARDMSEKTEDVLGLSA